MEKRFVNIKDLADYLGVSKHTVKSWVYKDRLPCKRIGRTVRFDLKEIEQILRKGDKTTPHFV